MFLVVGCFTFFFKSLALVNEDLNIPDEIQGERLVYFSNHPKSFKGKALLKLSVDSEKRKNLKLG